MVKGSLFYFSKSDSLPIKISEITYTLPYLLQKVFITEENILTIYTLQS